MSDGYQIVEPPCLDFLFGEPKCFDLAVILLQWIACEANTRKLVGQGTVEVIRVEYAGAYPALGVRGHLETAEPILNQFSAELVQSRSLREFIDFAAKSSIHWRNHAVKILSPNGGNQ